MLWLFSLFLISSTNTEDTVVTPASHQLAISWLDFLGAVRSSKFMNGTWLGEQLNRTESLQLTTLLSCTLAQCCFPLIANFGMLTWAQWTCYISIMFILVKCVNMTTNKTAGDDGNANNFTFMLKNVTLNLMTTSEEKSKNHSSEHECLYQISWQCIWDLLRHFTQSHKCHSRTRGEV